MNGGDFMGFSGLKRWGHKSHINGTKRFLSSKLGRRQMELIVRRLKKLQEKLKRIQKTKEVSRMKKIALWFFVLLIFLGGCATGPINNRETFLDYNQDPKVGKITNRGTTHLEIWITDEAGRIIEHNYIAGANQILTINNQHISKYYIWKLEFGRYEVKFVPFYYETNFINPLFGRPIRHPRKMQKQIVYIYVDKNPTDYYDYETGEYFGWGIDLNGGNIPQTTHGLPRINLDLQGGAWKLLLGR